MTFSLTFPDGTARDFEASLTGGALAASISKSLQKKAIALKVDGVVKDLSTVLDGNATVEILTRDSDDALELIRHDTAHVMAEAVQALYPGTQVTIGPSIKNGFYYDFARSTPFTTEDLTKIENKMRAIIKRDEAFVREEWKRDKAINYFEEKGEIYKAEIIRDLPGDEVLSIYRQGDWLDLCRGPHLPSTRHIGQAFKLMKLAGAYWRGDSNKEMLQRIYGTAWRSEKELKAYLYQLEEAEKRDHRRLGKEMDLFHFQEHAPGSVFWHAKGWTLFQTLQNHIRRKQTAAGYVEVNTPDIMDRALWEASGHWEKFGDNMFTTQTPDDRIFALKPMSCPGNVQVFNQGIKSYRDLPLRMAEFGKVHRYEPSGALHGLMRVRSFTQDDAHVFCTEAQVAEECIAMTRLILDVYKDFGFENIRIKFADRPEKRVGEDSVWDKAEAALHKAIESTGLAYTLNKGEGAFYGPKLEFVLQDAIGRDWQCGTVQVDLNLPKRLKASYITAKGEKCPPVLIHRAIFGSLERFIGILIEHYAGRFPLWLAPAQVVIATITSEGDSYALEVAEKFKKAGLKTAVDLRNEKISYKIREHSLAKIPVLGVVGKQEKENGTIALRRLGGKTQDIIPLDKAIERLQEEAHLV